MKKLINKIITTYKNLNVSAKATIWFIFSNIFVKGISVFTLPIFTRLLTTEEYGNYSLYLSWLSIFTVITSLNLYYGAFNNALNKYKDEKSRFNYIASMQGIITVLVIIVAIIYFCNINYWNDQIGLPTPVIILMFIELIVSPSMLFWTGKQRFEFKYKSMVGLTIFKSLLNPILSIILVFAWPSNKDFARIIAIVIVEILTSGVLYVYHFIKGNSFYNKEHWKYALKFNIPLLPHYLSGTLLNQSDRIMIEKLVGKTEVALYSVAYNIGMLALIFTNALNSSLTPWMYQQLNNKNYNHIKNNMNLILTFLATLIILLINFAPEIIWFFGSEKYMNSIYVIPPIATSVFFIFMYNIFAIPQMYYEYNKFMPIASVLAAGLNILLNYIFIPIYGYVAAAYTTLFCYILYSVGHFIVTKYICSKVTPGIDLFDYKFISFISLVLILISIILTIIYNQPIIRYVISLIILILIISNKNKIINLYYILFKKN